MWLFKKDISKKRQVNQDLLELQSEKEFQEARSNKKYKFKAMIKKFIYQKDVKSQLWGF